MRLIDPSGEEIAGPADTPLGGGTHSTDVWRRNEIVFGEIKIPAKVLAGFARPYRIRFGLYQSSTGKHALIQDTTHTAIGDYIDLVIP